MSAFRVWVACMLLTMTFGTSSGRLLQTLNKCPTCPTGYFVMKNCSMSPERREGVQCGFCSDCAAIHQDTLVKCSMFADSVCGNKTTVAVSPPDPPAVSAPETWITLTVLLVSVFLILLITFLLSLVLYHNQHGNQHKGWILV